MYDDDRDEVYDERDDEHIHGWCEACGSECTSVTQDDGIGPYEYFGARGTHHDYVEVSPCCQAEVLENEPELEHECV